MQIANRGKAAVNFFTRVDPEIDALRRRLQAETGWAAPRLVTEALLALAAARQHKQAEVMKEATTTACEAA
jgi:hypothetical protein